MPRPGVAGGIGDHDRRYPLRGAAHHLLGEIAAQAQPDQHDPPGGNLAEQGYDLNKIPYVIQYNKRDLPNAVTVEEMRKALNPRNIPEYQAVAPTGVGVFDTLKAVAKLVLTELKKGG